MPARTGPKDFAPKPRRSMAIKSGKRVGPVSRKGLGTPETQWRIVKGSVPKK